MKFFAPALIFCGAAAFGQSPQVPHKMQFAGMTLTVRDDARREIQKDVDALTQSPKHFNVKAERAKTYFPIIEKIFAEEGLPEDFKYLCLQESALIPDAVSTSNAVGFWQFKDFTAVEMGLRVDSEIDERMNIASSSRAAAKYLKKNNHYFNNWVYALQSYQMGAGGVLRAVGDKDLGARHMEISSDTYWYVKKFLAHKVAFENSVSGKPALAMTPLPSTQGKSIREIAGETSVDEERLREFNKWLKSNKVPHDKEYAFLIPSGVNGAEFSILATAKPKVSGETTTLPTERVEVNGIPVIRAMKGETLQALASRGNLGLKKLLRYNEMTIDKPMQAGQLYFLEGKKKKAADELYTLQPGESLWTVSQKFGIQQKALMKLNKLEPGSKPEAGFTLYLRSSRPDALTSYSGEVAVLNQDEAFNWVTSGSHNTPKLSTITESSSKQVDVPSGDSEKSIQLIEIEEPGTITFHEVKSTDTLYSVARQYGVTIKELMEWNDKKDLAVSVGEKLKVYTH